MGYRRDNVRTFSQITFNFLTQASWRWNQITSDLLVYNFQLPYKYDHWNFSFGGRHLATSSGGKYYRLVRQDWQEKHDWHLNLTFQDTSVKQLSQFLRCFLNIYGQGGSDIMNFWSLTNYKFQEGFLQRDAQKSSRWSSTKRPKAESRFGIDEYNKGKSIYSCLSYLLFLSQYSCVQFQWEFYVFLAENSLCRKGSWLEPNFPLKYHRELRGLATRKSNGFHSLISSNIVPYVSKWLLL